MVAARWWQLRSGCYSEVMLVGDNWWQMSEKSNQCVSQKGNQRLASLHIKQHENTTILNILKRQDNTVCVRGSGPRCH